MSETFVVVVVEPAPDCPGGPDREWQNWLGTQFRVFEDLFASVRPERAARALSASAIFLPDLKGQEVKVFRAPSLDEARQAAMEWMYREADARRSRRLQAH